jgi:hypothetical protein
MLIILDKKAAYPPFISIDPTSIGDRSETGHWVGQVTWHIHPPHHIMRGKPPSELTKVEKKLLGTAARLFAALQSVIEDPPAPKKEIYLSACVMEEMVSTLIAFHIEGTS